MTIAPTESSAARALRNPDEDGGHPCFAVGGALPAESPSGGPDEDRGHPCFAVDPSGADALPVSAVDGELLGRMEA